MPKPAKEGSRRQIAERRRNHIRNLAKLGLDDYALAEQLTKESGQYVTPTVAGNLKRSILDEAINGALDPEQERRLMIMQIDSQIQFCLTKARETNQEGTKGKIGWQKEIRSLLNRKAKLLGLDQTAKETFIPTEPQKEDDFTFATPEGMTISENYPWLQEKDPRKAQAIHDKFIEDGRDRTIEIEDLVTDAEFTDNEETNDESAATTLDNTQENNDA